MMEVIERAHLNGIFFPVADTTVRRPAVILAPTIAGIDDYIRRVASRLNDSGYAAFVVDYYPDGHLPDLSSLPNIMQAVAALSDREVVGRMSAAFEYLAARPDIDAQRIATLGFCVGGTMSFLAGCQVRGLAASVMYYGTLNYAVVSENKPISPIDAARELNVPLLGHFGGIDAIIPVADVAELRRCLVTAGKSFEVFEYAGAPHAFDEDFRSSFRPVAAREAWSRTLTFLDWHLGRQDRRAV